MMAMRGELKTGSSAEADVSEALCCGRDSDSLMGGLVKRRGRPVKRTTARFAPKLTMGRG